MGSGTGTRLLLGVGGTAREGLPEEHITSGAPLGGAGGHRDGVERL